MKTTARIWLLPSLAIAFFLAAEQPAAAGLLNKELDFLYLMPTIGAETSYYLGIGNSGAVKSTDFNTTGIAYGALAGFRLGKYSIGALFQRTDLQTTPQNTSINLN